METGDEKLVLGRINAAFGIKGWVKIQSFTASDEDLFGYQPLWCKHRGGWKLLELDSWRRHGKGFVAHIKGCDDRNLAETYSRCDLGTEPGQLPALSDGEFYWHELQGLEVYTAFSGEEVLLGVVDHLQETGANDVLVLVPSGNSVDDRQRMIPYLPGQFVTQVDLESGRINVDWDPEF